jgi:hypothetical protein
MRSATFVVLSIFAGWLFLTAQTIPGLPTDPSKRDVQPRVVKGQTEVKPEDAMGSHRQALSELHELIQEAESLREEMEENGAAVISAQSIRRSERLERLSKKIRARLKRG